MLANHPFLSTAVFPSELYLKDRKVLHEPETLLGDLIAKPKQEWPNYKDLDRKEYLREKPEYEDLIFHFMKEVMLDECFKMNATKHNLSNYMDKSLESYLVVTYVNSYYSWWDECNKQDDTPEDVTTLVSNLTEGTAREKMYTSNGRGSGKFKGWSDGGTDLYNEMQGIIQDQRDDESKAILRNFESRLQRRFDAAKRGRAGGNSNRQRKRARNSLQIALDQLLNNSNSARDDLSMTPV